MKKKLIFLSLIIFAGYILIFPKDAVDAASSGLVLWYERVLPTLLPFSILSNILIRSGYLTYLNRLFAPVITRIFPVSANGAFVLLSGFLFGFPMGSKNCAELLRCGQLEKREADVLFVITNNISPVFISSYILCGQLKLPSLTAVSYLVLYLPPLLFGWFLLQNKSSFAPHANHPSRTAQDIRPAVQGSSRITQKMPASGSQMNFKIIDAGIMNGFETLTRLGGYIMLFSMAASMQKRLPSPAMLRLFLTGMTEITNGIGLLPAAGICTEGQYVLAMIFTAFGGLSGIAQTSSMVKDTGLSMRSYCITKLLFTLCSLLLALCVCQLYPVS